MTLQMMVTATLADRLLDSNRSEARDVFDGSVPATGIKHVYRRFPRLQLAVLQSAYDKLNVNVSFVVTAQGKSHMLKEQIQTGAVAPNATLVIDCLGYKDTTGQSVSSDRYTYTVTQYTASSISYLEIRVTDSEGAPLYTGHWGTAP